MYCPAEDWIKGSSITFDCFVLKTAFPSLCVTFFNDVVLFRVDPNGKGYGDICTLYNATNTCTPSNNACSCEAGNATHYKFEFTFIAHTDYDGSWDCSVPCFSGFTPQLTYSHDNCDKRVVIGTNTQSLLFVAISFFLSFFLSCLFGSLVGWLI